MRYSIASWEPKVVESTLSDGSKVYNVYTPELKFVCTGKQEAENLASVLFHSCIEIETVGYYS